MSSHVRCCGIDSLTLNDMRYAWKALALSKVKASVKVRDARASYDDMSPDPELAFTSGQLNAYGRNKHLQIRFIKKKAYFCYLSLEETFMVGDC